MIWMGVGGDNKSDGQAKLAHIIHNGLSLGNGVDDYSFPRSIRTYDVAVREKGAQLKRSQ